MDSLREAEEAAAKHRSDKDYPTIYTVNQGTQTVKKESIFEKEISYKGTDHQKFFDDLRAIGGIVQEGHTLKVKPTLETYFSATLDELKTRYEELKRKAGKGGSRRRPSRKYKKSKRVLRRKSRSTRRR
jgi:hypothetical protein